MVARISCSCCCRVWHAVSSVALLPTWLDAVRQSAANVEHSSSSSSGNNNNISNCCCCCAACVSTAAPRLTIAAQPTPTNWPWWAKRRRRRWKRRRRWRRRWRHRRRSRVLKLAHGVSAFTASCWPEASVRVVPHRYSARILALAFIWAALLWFSLWLLINSFISFGLNWILFLNHLKKPLTAAAVAAVYLSDRQFVCLSFFTLINSTKVSGPSIVNSFPIAAVVAAAAVKGSAHYLHVYVY